MVALQGHWKSKISRNVQKLVLLKKINVFFEKKIVIFLKNCQR